MSFLMISTPDVFRFYVAKLFNALSCGGEIDFLNLSFCLCARFSVRSLSVSALL